MKRSNRILTMLLALVLAFGTIMPVQAADTLITSNEPGQAIEMVIEDNAIVFNSFPEGDEYKYIWIEIEGYPKKICAAFNGIKFTLPVQDGTYYVNLGRNSERYGWFDYFAWGKDIGIEVKDGVASFIESPVLEKNQTLYAENSDSKIALAYYQEPSLWVESDARKIKEQAEKIVDPEDSDYVKLQKVHDWVANNVWYDFDDYYGRVEGEVTALEVLQSRKSVCQGYADLTAALLRSLGIPTKVVSGYALGMSTGREWTESAIAKEESNHAWNEAYVDGRWVIIDTTWDSGNVYENGEYSSGTGLKRRRYFDPTLEMFSKTHKMLETDDYDEEKDSFIEEKLSISQKSATLKKGASLQLKIKTSAEYINLKDAKITYASKNSSIASVSKTGKIKAKKTGSTTIVTKVKMEGATISFTTKIKVK